MAIFIFNGEVTNDNIDAVKEIFEHTKERDFTVTLGKCGFSNFSCLMNLIDVHTLWHQKKYLYVQLKDAQQAHYHSVEARLKELNFNLGIFLNKTDLKLLKDLCRRHEKMYRLNCKLTKSILENRHLAHMSKNILNIDLEFIQKTSFDLLEQTIIAESKSLENQFIQLIDANKF